MNWGELLRNIIFGLAAFGAGISFVLGVKRFARYTSSKQRLHLAQFLYDVGVAGVIGLVLVRIVIPISELPVGWDTVAFAVCLAFVGFGALGIYVESTKGGREDDDQAHSG